ncbi:hypothetical protein BH20ACT16_BH20ACT16_08890 [soil metagenome]
METLRVEAALLRAVLPDLVLREGMKVVASVAERAGQKGIIVLAGTPLAAQLPDEVRAGDVLRLIVAETGGERVVLRIIDGPQTAQAPPPAVAVPLPGGMQARVVVTERDDGAARSGADDEQQEVRLTYTSARLGALDLHLALTAGGELLRVNVRARAGAPFELAERHAA